MEEKASYHQIVAFKLGSEEYGLHIDQIKEVVIAPPITRLPLTPPFIKGVANIRGNIIAILDLEQKFGLAMEAHDEAGKNFVLVIESDEYKMGVLVREVPNTLSIAASNIEETFLMNEYQNDQNYIKGIAKLDKRLIIMIDILRIFDEKEVAQIVKKGLASVTA